MRIEKERVNVIMLTESQKKRIKKRVHEWAELTVSDDVQVRRNTLKDLIMSAEELIQSFEERKNVPDFPVILKTALLLGRSLEAVSWLQQHIIEDRNDPFWENTNFYIQELHNKLQSILLRKYEIVLKPCMDKYCR